jgi:hypothetical protein
VFHALSNMPLRDRLLYAVHARFWMQPNALAFLLAGAGLAAAADALARALGATPADEDEDEGAGAGAGDGSAEKLAGRVGGGRSGGALRPSVLLPLALCLLGPLGAWRQHGANVARSDFSDVDVMARYARTLLAPLPRRAVLVTSYDMQWTSARYLQACEGVRTDVRSFRLRAARSSDPLCSPLTPRLAPRRAARR